LPGVVPSALVLGIPEPFAPGLDPDAPILLVGGGSRGRVWQETIRRLSGRPLLVPAHDELVALGAAAQAAGVLHGEAPGDVARRWETSAGTRLDAVPRDEDALARIRSVRERSEPLDRA